MISNAINNYKIRGHEQRPSALEKRDGGWASAIRALRLGFRARKRRLEVWRARNTISVSLCSDSVEDIPGWLVMVVGK